MASRTNMYAQYVKRRGQPPPPRAHVRGVPRTVHVDQGYAPDLLVSTDPLYRPPAGVQVDKLTGRAPAPTPTFEWSRGRKPRAPKPVPRRPKRYG